MVRVRNKRRKKLPGIDNNIDFLPFEPLLRVFGYCFGVSVEDMIPRQYGDVSKYLINILWSDLNAYRDWMIEILTSLEHSLGYWRLNEYQTR